MFKLFNKSDEIKVIDTIWMTEEAKWKACKETWSQDQNTLFAAWFEETFDKLHTLLGDSGAISSLRMARELQSHEIRNNTIIFVEHYPLKKKEQELYLKLQLPKAHVYSSLDEPFFKNFGGEKIAQLMKQLGMEESASIEHKMITNAIKNAQEKLDKKISMEISARSPEDWFTNNLQ